MLELKSSNKLLNKLKLIHFKILILLLNKSYNKITINKIDTYFIINKTKHLKAPKKTLLKYVKIKEV